MSNVEGYEAYKVMYAIHSVYSELGNANYAKTKTNSFLQRCGADINEPFELLSKEAIQSVAYGALDKDTEAIFWGRLEGRNGTY